MKPKNGSSVPARERRPEEGAEKPKTVSEAIARIPETMEWLSIKDMIRVFAVHEVTIHRWIQTGNLTRYKARTRGSALLFKREDVIRFTKKWFGPRTVTAPPGGLSGKVATPGGGYGNAPKAKPTAGRAGIRKRG